ncbi:ferritin [Thiomicrorhabdus sp.]|uniref:ferritin n=1 Tax=Thiomicrorhabdus sp. TaxID=2039724 RepID=UPI0029C71B26|nr:ferritin [Thiomicrorhabdus sp.]
MLNEEIKGLLNKQVNAEFFASNIYLQMCAWAEGQGLDGAAAFFRNHSLEERGHMDKIFNYMAECGAAITIEGIPQPPNEFANLMDVLNAAYEHEKKVTAMIKKIAKASFDCEDYTTFNFIEWFIAEQHEEEVLFSKVLSKAEMLGFTGQPGQSLHIMDNFLRQVASGH